MSKPQDGFTPPDLSGQTRIMFFNEGNPVAALVFKRSISHMPFKTAELALAWCRKHGAILVYTPANLEAN